MTTEESDPPYEVGYRKPPAHTRWKKGQSGNSRGRPKKSAGLEAAFHKALQEKVSVIENGRKSKITKIEAAIKQLTNRAASGDRHSMKMLLDIYEKTKASRPEDPLRIIIEGGLPDDHDPENESHIHEIVVPRS